VVAVFVAYVALSDPGRPRRAGAARSLTAWASPSP
jgi:hypothetical protein